MLNSIQFLLKSFTLNVGRFSVPIPYWEAAAIVVLLFVLILTFAEMRKHYVDWSFKGGLAGIFFGFLLALILEGFLLIGGRTAITGILGWKNPPKPVAHVLDAGKTKLIQVLGAQTQIPASLAKENTSVQGALETIQSLNPQDVTKVKSILCK